MTLKNIPIGVKIFLSVLIAITFVVIIRNRVLATSPRIHLPNQEKEWKITIDKNVLEANLFVYVEKKHEEDIGISVYDSEGDKATLINIGEDRFTPEGKFYYVYGVKPGKTYLIKFKNKTDEMLYSSVNFETTD